jgi:hypothetical protein
LTFQGLVWPTQNVPVAIDDTVDGSALAGRYYQGTSGTLAFAAGETAKTVTVTTLGGSSASSDEYLGLRLSDSSGPTIGYVGVFYGWLDVSDGLNGTVTISGPRNASTILTVHGNYALTGLPGGIYTVTVTPSGRPCGSGCLDEAGCDSRRCVPARPEVPLCALGPARARLLSAARAAGRYSWSTSDSIRRWVSSAASSLNGGRDGTTSLLA